MLHPGSPGGGRVPWTVFGGGEFGSRRPLQRMMWVHQCRPAMPPAPSGLVSGTLVTTMHFVTLPHCLEIVFLCFGFHCAYSVGFSCTLLLLVTGWTLLCGVRQWDPLGWLQGAHPAALSHPFLNRTGAENTWKIILG